jgi:hypothetical protein
MPIELLVDFDDILKKSRDVLTEMGKVPADCPKVDCLKVFKFVNEANPTFILSADPPQTENPPEIIPRYEIPEVCKELCGIRGNRFRGFKITVAKETGMVLETKSDHFNNL